MRFNGFRESSPILVAGLIACVLVPDGLARRQESPFGDPVCYGATGERADPKPVCAPDPEPGRRYVEWVSTPTAAGSKAALDLFIERKAKHDAIRERIRSADLGRASGSVRADVLSRLRESSAKWPESYSRSLDAILANGAEDAIRRSLLVCATAEDREELRRKTEETREDLMSGVWCVRMLDQLLNGEFDGDVPRFIQETNRREYPGLLDEESSGDRAAAESTSPRQIVANVRALMDYRFGLDFHASSAAKYDLAILELLWRQFAAATDDPTRLAVGLEISRIRSFEPGTSKSFSIEACEAVARSSVASPASRSHALFCLARVFESDFNAKHDDRIAADLFRVILEVHPWTMDYGNALIEWAELESKFGDHRAVIALLEQVFALDFDRGVLGEDAQIAMSRLSDGRRGAAALLGRSYERIGESEKAIDWYSKALRDYPSAVYGNSVQAFEDSLRRDIERLRDQRKSER